MKLGLDDRTILITGAASGIGAAIARALDGEGVGALILVDRNGDGLKTLAATLTAPTETVTTDLTDPTAPASIAAQTIQRFGRIDGLVNSAGLTTRASFTTGTVEIWDQLYNLNARAAFFLMQAAILDMTARQAPGVIVNIMSMNAHCGIPELAIYASTKGALATLTKNAAHAHMADRIRVNGINLGWVATESERRMQAEDLGHGPDWLEKAQAAMPLGRLVTAEECARLALFLLSDASIPMSGALIDLEQKVAGAL